MYRPIEGESTINIIANRLNMVLACSSFFQDFTGSRSKSLIERVVLTVQFEIICKVPALMFNFFSHEVCFRKSN